MAAQEGRLATAVWSLSSFELMGILGTCFSLISRPQRDHHQGLTLSSYGVSSDTMPPATPDGAIVWPLNLQSFLLNELRAATRNFHQDGFLSESSLGPVFRGWIDQHTLAASTPENGVAVAVKMLKPGSTRGHHEWLTELKYLGHLKHPNLVKLVGYCIEDNLRLLVYEFMNRGTLESRLCGKDAPSNTSLTWNVRMKIALSCANALAFLHDEAQVAHQSFCASNILLDSNYNAKLVDFGLVMDEPMGHLSVKDDVYMFGIVLLQMLSGRRAMDYSRPPGEQSLVEWAMPCIANKRKVRRVLDDRLEGQCTSGSVLRVAEIIVRCLSAEPRSRPDMKNVVEALEQIQDSQ